MTSIETTEYLHEPENVTIGVTEPTRRGEAPGVWVEIEFDDHGNGYVEGPFASATFKFSRERAEEIARLLTEAAAQR